MAPTKEKKYIYDLPYLEFKACCNILDENNLWEELSVHMGYDKDTILEVKREVFCGKSPSEKLLGLWGHLNHTVVELLVLLDRMKIYHATDILKKFVNPIILVKLQYHGHQQVKNQSVQPIKENHVESEKILNVPKSPDIIVSEENNESRAAVIIGSKMPHLALPHVGNTRMTTVSGKSMVDAEVPTIPYEDLTLATNNWNPKLLLGQGGFATVYKGTWKCTEVAIKRIDRKEDNPNSYIEQVKQSMTELRYLNSYRHDNILPLYGFSKGGPYPCLVYQFMRGGSLEGRLKDSKRRLNWSTRLSIAIGTARGLQFLHTIGDKPLVHGDIKPGNILLDTNDFPRIGDFGLAREGPHEEYMRISKVHGTRPYLPHEFLRGKKFSTKVDTFSFGVVLFEIATGLPAFKGDRPVRFLKALVADYEGDVLDLKDRREPGGEACFKGLVEVGMLCVSHWAKDRPEMVGALKMLEKLEDCVEEC